MNYKRDFKKRRLIILLPLIPAAIAAALGLVTDNTLWGYVFVAAALVFALLHVLLWRCPECNSYMGRGIFIPVDGRCPMCKMQIAEPAEGAVEPVSAELPEKQDETN